MPRCVRGSGKADSQFWQRGRRGEVRGFPVTSVKAMEKNFGRRPVKGGPARQGPKIAANASTRGVQGSCGPLVGGRRIETAGPLVLSVMKEQRCNEKMVKRQPPSQPSN